MAAGHYKMNRLTMIVDKNGLQMTGPTKDVMNIDPLDMKLEAFGWDTYVVADGNDMAQVCAAFEYVNAHRCGEKPTAVIANTIKGKGVSFMENNVKWHGGGIAKAELDVALGDIEKAWAGRNCI